MAILKVPVTKEDHIQGKENALITLVEYGDYECPHCGRAYPLVKELQKYFKENLCFVFRNFPLKEAHPYAEAAAETAEFAASHGKFWQMHDLIFENQRELGTPLFEKLVSTLKLPTKELEEALLNKTFEPKIQKDFMGGLRSGVNGTPTFYINNHRYDGMVDFDDMTLAISTLLT